MDFSKALIEDLHKTCGNKSNSLLKISPKHVSFPGAKEECDWTVFCSRKACVTTTDMPLLCHGAFLHSASSAEMGVATASKDCHKIKN